MRPVLFTLGPIAFHSWGVMVGLGLFVAYLVLHLEHRRRGLRGMDGDGVYLCAVVGGFVGARLAYVRGRSSEVMGGSLVEWALPDGFLWYGAVIGGALAVLCFVRIRRLPLSTYLDMLGLSCAAGYALGRLGCHLAGDGDYGRPTDLPIGAIFANGVVKPTEAVADFFARHPELAELWSYYSLRSTVVGHDRFGIVTAFDRTVRLHPSSAYEFVLGATLFIVLWMMRTGRMRPGVLFMTFAGTMGLQRLLVESVGMEPDVLLGLSAVQLQSIVLVVGTVVAGAWMRLRA